MKELNRSAKTDGQTTNNGDADLTIGSGPLEDLVAIAEIAVDIVGYKRNGMTSRRIHVTWKCAEDAEWKNYLEDRLEDEINKACDCVLDNVWTLRDASAYRADHLAPLKWESRERWLLGCIGMAR